MTTVLALAGLSVRMLVEAANDGGLRSVALDLFGDADTRRAARAWWPIGDPARLAIDGEALLAVLHRLRGAGVAGWVAGSGFEGMPGVLAAAARLLPLIGNTPEVAAAVRDPACFFGRLDALRIPHPETRLTLPPDAAGWLRKNAGSSGGWDVRPVGGAALPGSHAMGGSADPAWIHYQRVVPGLPMSALFLADGRRGHVLGVNRQIARSLDDRPFVFRGCIGPLPVTPALRDEVHDIIDVLVEDFGLRGLNGLDFLLDGDRLNVLELNPRPPASMALYRDALPGGLVRAHLAASQAGRLPVAAVRVPERTAAATAVRGFEVVFARASRRLDAAATDTLARRPWCHDLPLAGSHLMSGAPVCTVSAAADTAAEVQALLARRRRRIPFLLEQHDESSVNTPSEPRIPGQHVLECQ